MSIAKKTMIDMIYKMTDDKVIKILSFAKFIENERDNELLFADDEEDEIIHLLETDERIDGSSVLNEILGSMQ